MGDHISAWMPEQDRNRLAVLGKLIEECNELSARAARCIIHGLDECDPDSGLRNRDELGREVSDLKACLDLLYERTGICSDYDRRTRKADGYRHWHGLIEAAR